MPKELEDCVAKVKSQGATEQEAYAICHASLDIKKKSKDKNKKEKK